MREFYDFAVAITCSSTPCASISQAHFVSLAPMVSVHFQAMVVMDNQRAVDSQTIVELTQKTLRPAEPDSPNGRAAVECTEVSKTRPGVRPR